MSMSTCIRFYTYLLNEYEYEYHNITCTCQVVTNEYRYARFDTLTGKG